MTVIELIEELKKYPENIQVALYNEMSEDSILSSELKIHNKQNGPYNKGDDVWDLWEIDQNEELLFIK